MIKQRAYKMLIDKNLKQVKNDVINKLKKKYIIKCADIINKRCR